MRRLLYAVMAVGTVALVWAQGDAQQAIPPTVSCESNLEQARNENIQLRKQLAQTMFQAAALEEQGIALKKQVDAANAQGKAAEKK